MSESKAVDVAWSVAAVTVYEDRADVVREGAVDVAAGAAVLAFRGVSALVDEDRLMARFDGDGHVDDVVVVRRYVDDGKDEIVRRRAARHKEREQLNDQLRAVHDDVDHAHRAVDGAEAALAVWVEAQARALGKGKADDGVDHGLAEFRAALTTATTTLATAQAQQARLELRLHKLQLDDERPSSTTQRRVCDVLVRVSSRGGPARVVLTTVLPCAAWRPTHEARLLRAAPPSVEHRVRFITHGAVWNRTGEAWRRADGTGPRLTLSTARPALGAELPPLSEDRLRLRHKTAEEKKTIVIEHRVEKVPPSATAAGNGGGAPGVDDGGEVRVFVVDHADVPDDGRPHTVELSSFEAPCALARVALPEKAPQVFVRASFKNVGRVPLLAGPVTLVDDGAWTGTGDVLYTGAGDDLDLSFGSDDRLAVRMVKRVIVEKRTLGKDLEHYLQEITVTSTSPAPEAVQLVLRLPVSEVAQVKVLQSPQHGTEGELKLDSHGLARVNVVVEPGKDKRVAAAFVYETSGDVVVPRPWG